MSARCCWLLATFLLAAPPWAGASQVASDLKNTRNVLSCLIDRAIKDSGVPSISIALVKDDAIVWDAAFGYANVAARIPATSRTLYSAGSTFKSVTATALMQLAEQQKFRLDEPVNRYLGELRIQDRLQSEQAVTFEHVLSHWSGLSGEAQTKPLWTRQQPRSLSALVGGLYSIRAPEAKYEYNNAAYAMAGLLVEKIAGTEYERYVVERVLQPLGVTTAHPIYPSPEMVELMALPYERGKDGRPPTPVAQVRFDVYPAGDAYLTAADMARFLGAHLNGGMFNGQRILSEATVKNMHTPRFGGDYGLGFNVTKDDQGHTLISHGGSIPGFNSFLLGDVDARVGVYLMCNTRCGEERKPLAEAALKLLHGEQVSCQTPNKMSR